MKILSILIGLLLITTLAFAASVYIEETDIVLRIELKNGIVFVEERTTTFKDGKPIAPPHLTNHLLQPGEDLGKEIQKVRDIVEGIWTEDVIKKYKEKKAKRALDIQ